MGMFLMKCGETFISNKEECSKRITELEEISENFECLFEEDAFNFRLRSLKKFRKIL